ncbi:MAG: ABC transporter permease [Deinococcota bacterium]
MDSQVVARVKRALIRPASLVSLLFLLTVVSVSIFAPAIAPYDPIRIDLLSAEQPPSLQHLFGTDDVGRDVFSRVVWGGRISLTMGLVAAGIATVLGLVLGTVSGYYEGSTGYLILRAMDFLLAFPGILLALAIVAILGASLANVMIAIGIGATPAFVRLVHGVVLSIKQNDYIEAAKAFGASDTHIFLKYILPNILPFVIVIFTIQVASAIFYGSSLSFIGLGAQPPSPEWGAMVSRGRYSLRNALWMSAFPGATIALVCIAINLLGDALRDALDPRSS